MKWNLFSVTVKAYDGLALQFQFFLTWESEGINCQLHLMADWYLPGLAEYEVHNRVYIRNLTLYVPCIMFQCVDKPTRWSSSYEWSLLSIIWLYMFRTITSPSSGASSHKLYNALVCLFRRVYPLCGCTST